MPRSPLFPAILAFAVPAFAETHSERITAVTKTPGLVALWDFVRREEGGEKRFLAHVPEGTANDCPLDVANYIKDYWDTGPKAGYADFPLRCRRVRPGDHAGGAGGPRAIGNKAG